MLNRTTWYLASAVGIMYTLLPALWMLSMVGVELPVTVVTYQSVFVCAIGCIVIFAIGYSTGQSYPGDTQEPDILSWRKQRKE